MVEPCWVCIVPTVIPVWLVYGVDSFSFWPWFIVLAIYPLAILGHETAVLCCMCIRSKQLAKYLLISLFSDESVRFIALRKRAMFPNQRFRGSVK